MTGWTGREAEFLQEQWVRDDGSLTLPVACPHCLHPDAFQGLVVYDRTVGGDGFGDAVADDEALRGREGDGRVDGFPDRATVVCACGHTDHAPSKGCGRDGNIKTSARLR